MKIVEMSILGDGKIQVILAGDSNWDIAEYAAMQMACDNKQNIRLKSLPDKETREKIIAGDFSDLPLFSLFCDEMIDLSVLGFNANGGVLS